MATVEYQLTKRELILTATLRIVLRARTLVAIGYLLFMGLLLIWFGDAYRIIGWVCLALAMLWPLIFLRAIQRIVNANPVLTSKITMHFDEVGIVSVSPGYRSEREWLSFFGWSHSDKYFFLKVDKLGTPITIPKRAFTDAQLKMFFEQLSHINHNQAHA